MMPEPLSERAAQPANLALVEHRLSRIEETVTDHGERFKPLEDDLHTIRRDLIVVRDRQTWLIWGAALVLSTVIGGAATISTRMILDAVAVSERTAQVERLEALADVIEQGGIRRNADGTPALAELQRALPHVRGISRSERAAACLRAETRVPGVCSVPSP